MNNPKTSLQSEVADALWMVLRECEDKCDLELEDVSSQHVVWQLANIAIGFIRKEAAPCSVGSGEVRKSLNASVADLLRPFLKPGQKVIWREPFRWFDDNGVLSNHYDSMNVASLADDFGYDYDWELAFEHAAIVWPKAATAAATEGAV